jgi:glucose-6-phosphate 1-dehydrogenase
VLQAGQVTVSRLIVLGATGDLTRRYLLPGLARLAATGRLPDGLRVVASAVEDLDDDGYRRLAQEALVASDADPATSKVLLSGLSYVPADVTRRDDLQEVLGQGDGPVAVYLALPHTLAATVCGHLAAIGLPEGSHLVIEKPFGDSLESARQLNRAARAVVPERDVFRVDHFLAKSTVLNVLGLRFANRVFEPVWSNRDVEAVDIVFDETLGLEGRAGYYDRAGALRDMVQNHLLQVLCLVAMEPPPTLGETDLRDRKADVMRSVRPPASKEMERLTRRARWGVGELDGAPVEAYAEHDGVDPGRGTETYAEVTFFIDSWRWSGVPFRLRSGKALAAQRREAVIHFRPVPHLPTGLRGTPSPSRLRLGFGPDTLHLEIEVNGPGDPFELERAVLQQELAPGDLPAYAQVLEAVLEGDPLLSVRGDEAEEGWRVVEPVMRVWERGEVPLEEYPAGSSGPRPRPGDRPW